MPVHDTTTLTIASAIFRGWICTFGIPEVIISDNGPQFRDVFTEVCNLLGIEKRKSAPYRPQTNAVVERMHGTMKSIITTALSRYKDWEAALPLAELVLHTAINDRGVSPAMVMFGEQIPLPLALFEQPLNPDDVTSDQRMFVARLAHNLRMMRQMLLRADPTISPYLETHREFPIKFQMVYVKRPPPHRL